MVAENKKLESFGEARIARSAVALMRTSISLAGGNEVCFVAALDDDGVIVKARAVARGTVRSVLALPGFGEPGEMLLHNHPSGVLTPSEADLDTAARVHEMGIGFGIINNSADRVYVVAEVPKVRAKAQLSIDSVESVLGPNGAVSVAMLQRGGVRRYEDRPSQREMAAAVVNAYNSGSIALLEAGTGVGKSLGYLVPALRWSAANGERTVVSTNTITLQEQLVRKDLPFLESALTDQQVKFALLKGWRNYLCLFRLQQARGAGAALFEDNLTSELNMLAEWADNTKDGSISDLPVTPAHEVWDEVAAEPDLCTRMKCSFYDNCFVFRARREAAQANVIVVNHHLLLSDVAVRRTSQNWTDAAVLPAYSRLVIDEGHHIEDAASDHLGTSITWRSLNRLLSRLERRGRGLLPALAARLSMSSDLLSVASLDIVQERLTPSLGSARERAVQLFDLLRAVLDENNGNVLRLTESFQEHPVWKGGVEDSLAALNNELKLINDGLNTIRERLETNQEKSDALLPLVNELRAVGRRLDDCGGALVAALYPQSDSNEVVRWMEYVGSKSNNVRNVALHAVPLDLAPILRDDLFERVTSTIVTSATLAADGGFSYLKERLGLNNSTKTVNSESFPSPFDYPNQAILAVPDDLPAPNDDARAHFIAVAHQLRDLAIASDGGIFALFTSHKDVRNMAEWLRSEAQDVRWPLLVHGESQRDDLLRRFEDSGNAILLGTATFWEGIDMPGDALRGLLIAKIPFRVPTEPVVAAQCELIEARGGNSFNDYMLPNASLRLKQGFGRLIRSARDVGVVVISDPRVLTMPYGRRLLKGLPPAQRIRGPWESLRRDIWEFYKEKRSEGS